MRKILTGAAIFVVGFASALILTHGSLQAQDSTNNDPILNKLNEVAGKQEELVSALNSMKETLNSLKEDIQVIKIRVTQLQ